MKNDFVLWARQYSKRLITFLLIAWSIGAVIGVIYEFLRLVIAPEMADMNSLYIYLAVPLTCGIPSYLVPNMFLNKEKVRQNYIPNYDNIVLGGEYDEEDGMGNGTQNHGGANDTGFYAYSEAYSAQQGDPRLSDSGLAPWSGGTHGDGMEGVPDGNP